MYYFEILEGLYKSKVRYLVVGGLSVNLYGVPRVTQDIDIVIAMDRENVLKITISIERIRLCSAPARKP